MPDLDAVDANFPVLMQNIVFCLNKMGNHFGWNKMGDVWISCIPLLVAALLGQRCFIYSVQYKDS